MRIVKYIKNKNGMYTVELNNKFKIKIHEDLILKYDLLLKKEVDQETLEKIVNDNKTYEIYEVALKYIEKRLRSKKELTYYLLKKNYNSSDIDNTLSLLSNQGYLNDKLYANSYIHDRITLSNEGPNKIKAYLSSQDIDINIIEEAINAYDSELEKERVEKLIDKQIKLNNNKGSNLLKRKIQMYLLNLGYNYEIINSCLNNRNLVNKDLYQKEYDKIYTKLSKKYSGKELEYHLKQKMYQKGFSITDFYE